MAEHDALQIGDPGPVLYGVALPVGLVVGLAGFLRERDEEQYAAYLRSVFGLLEHMAGQNNRLGSLCVTVKAHQEADIEEFLGRNGVRRDLDSPFTAAPGKVVYPVVARLGPTYRRPLIATAFTAMDLDAELRRAGHVSPDGPLPKARLLWSSHPDTARSTGEGETSQS